MTSCATWGGEGTGNLGDQRGQVSPPLPQVVQAVKIGKIDQVSIACTMYYYYYYDYSSWWWWW